MFVERVPLAVKDPAQRGQVDLGPAGETALNTDMKCYTVTSAFSRVAPAPVHILN